MRSLVNVFWVEKSAFYFYAIIIPLGTVIAMDLAWEEQYTKSWTISCNHDIIGPFSIHGVRERWTKLCDVWNTGILKFPDCNKISHLCFAPIMLYSRNIL